jgi:hypothetical protein
MHDPEHFARILVCWRSEPAGSGQIVCELGRTADGLELRAVRPGDAVLRTAAVHNMTEAFELADRWKAELSRRLPLHSSPASFARPRTSSGQPTILEQRAKYRRGGDLRRMAD